MNGTPDKYRPLRSCISSDSEEVAVFGVDLLSDPPYAKYWFKSDPLSHTKCARALPIAGPDDIVILAGNLHEEYLEWLRSLNMGPREVVAYGLERSPQSLAEIIRDDPEPLKKALYRINRRAVYVPFYGGQREVDLAKTLGLDVFGCNESVTLEFYNKEKFKDHCSRLGIKTVSELARTQPGARGANIEGYSRIISALLKNYSSLVVKGALGATGSSVYRVESINMDDVIRKMADNSGCGGFMIEPFLKVIVSPNDQWVISRDGTISHLGISAQLFSGLTHAGNIMGQFISHRVENYISETSRKIVESMARAGYIGVVGIDYVVTDEDIFPIENNARFNGSSFAIGIFDKLVTRQPDLNCWKFIKASVDQMPFLELLKKLDQVVYDGRRRNSVFPFDADALPINGGFTALLVAEDMYHIQYLESALTELGIKRV